MRPRLLGEVLAAHTTRWIAIRWGEAFPFYHVVEHPKSGGTWLAQMVGDYLQLPFPQHSVLPLGFSCVVQSFGRYHPALRPLCYIYRDGRDVMTSLYFDRFRTAWHSRRPGKTRVARTYGRLFGADWDPRDVVRHLPRFIEFEFSHPGRGTPVSWRDHIASWYPETEKRQVTYCSYEALLQDCVGTLGRVIEELTGEPTDPWRLGVTVEKMSMKRQTGRSPGQGDITQHIRKGIAGDWRSSFSREAAQIFDALAGDTLVRLGYETDRGWVDRYEEAIP